jgi:class 3 adenylate cyclase
MQAPAPRVRFSLRWKITLPYMLLALVLGLGATLLINRLLGERERDRFSLLLADSGQQAADAVVRVERDLLEVERFVANTEGVLDAVLAADAEQLRILVLPLAVNARVDMLVVLDSTGTSLLAVRQLPGRVQGEYETLRGENFYAGWQAVQALLAGGLGGPGEKTAGLEALQVAGQPVSVFFAGGPLLRSDSRPVGAVLAGAYAGTLTDTLSEAAAAAANVSVYDRGGVLVGTTLELEPSDSLTLSDDLLQEATVATRAQSPVRRLEVAGLPYGEVLTPFVARDGTQHLGVLGISLLESALPVTTDTTTIIWFGALALLLIVLIGLLVSNSITRPLVTMAAASTQVATGDLQTRVPEGGSDEIGVLSRTFNRMLEGMREGLVYHDLLGRAVAPEVREQLRRTMSGEGGRAQVLPATILFVGLRGFTGTEDEAQAAIMLDRLNGFLKGALPRLGQHGGVVYRFDGEELLAFFGVLPRPLPAAVSALQATHAGLELMDLSRELNDARAENGGAPLEISLGAATGRVVAGGLGTQDRLQYTVVGQPVTVAGQLQEAAREMGGSRMLIGETTHKALGSARDHFIFGRYGQAQIRGYAKPLVVHEVTGRSVRLFERTPKEFWDKTTEPFRS